MILVLHVNSGQVGVTHLNPALRQPHSAGLLQGQSLVPGMTPALNAAGELGVLTNTRLPTTRGLALSTSSSVP